MQIINTRILRLSITKPRLVHFRLLSAFSNGARECRLPAVIIHGHKDKPQRAAHGKHLIGWHPYKSKSQEYQVANDDANKRQTIP